MTDTLYQILIHGDSAIMWVGTFVATLIATYVIALIHSERVRKYVGRAWVEVRAAVSEVYQTYVSALKEGAADGKLTDDEKAEAKRRAIAIAKGNIGKKGLDRLMRILGLPSAADGLDGWLGTHVEAAVDLAKKEGKAAEGTKPLIVASVGADSPLP